MVSEASQSESQAQSASKSEPQKMSNPDGKDNRKRLLINPAFQKDFLLYTCGIAAVVILMFFLGNEYVFYAFAEKARVSGLPSTHIFFKFLKDQHEIVTLYFGGISLLVFVTLVLCGLFLSNRVAGPIYRLECFLNDFNSGKIKAHMKFRKKDYFKEIEKPINDLIDRAKT